MIQKLTGFKISSGIFTEAGDADMSGTSENNKKSIRNYLLAVSGMFIFVLFILVVSINTSTYADTSGSGNKNGTAPAGPASGPTMTVTPTVKPAATPTVKPTVSPTPSLTPLVSPSVTPTQKLTPTPTVTPVPTVTPGPATPLPVPEVVGIRAIYEGSTLTIGDEIEIGKLKVYEVYSDGSTDMLSPQEYELSSKVIEKQGLNIFVVIYGKYTTRFYVDGRKLLRITASCELQSCSVGNMPHKSQFYVACIYSNGIVEQIRDGFTISPEVITENGKQTVTISYKGMTSDVIIVGKEPPKLSSIAVKYLQDSVYAETPIDRDDFEVTAIYSDYTTERITTFVLSQDRFTETGKQKLTVTHNGMSKVIEVEVTENKPVKIRAEYQGKSVIVGREFRKEDMKVYVCYANGDERETEDYTYHTRKIRYIGDNEVMLFYGNELFTSVNIIGTVVDEPDFDYVSELTATNGESGLKISTAIPRFLPKDSMYTKSIKKIVMKKAYKKLGLTSGDYIAFTYGFNDDDNELELPLTVRITIPEGFTMENTYLYYTPDRKSVLGRTNKTVIDDNCFETVLFKTGTYMLVYSEDFMEGEESEEEDSESEYID